MTKDISSGLWDKLMSHERQELKFGEAVIMVNDGVFTCDPTITYSSSMIIDELNNLEGLRVADIGTGSGVIAVVCALGGAREVVATDISEVAIANAKENVCLNKVENTVKVIKTSLLDGVEGEFDIICANLPILDEVWESQDIEVETTLELFLKQAESFLRPDGRIYLPWGSFADNRAVEALIKKYNYHSTLQSIEKLGFTWYLYTLSRKS